MQRRTPGGASARTGRPLVTPSAAACQTTVAIFSYGRGELPLGRMGVASHDGAGAGVAMVFPNDACLNDAKRRSIGLTLLARGACRRRVNDHHEQHCSKMRHTPEVLASRGTSVREFRSDPKDERNNIPPGLMVKLQQQRRDLLRRHGLAFLLAGLTLFLRSVLPFPEGTSIYQLPIAAVILSGWYGGRGPGLLASLICVTGVYYLFVPPVHSFAIAPDHVLPFSIFVTLCLLLTEFSAGRRRAEHALRASDADLKRADAERRQHVWFLESMDRINRAMQGTTDVERMMSDVLDAVLEIFACDRAWILYPCDPDAPSWRAVMEHTRPEFRGAGARGRELTMTADAAEVARAALASRACLPAGPGHERQVKREIAEQFGVRSELLMALHAIGDRPHLFGLHQCSRPRTWTKEEQRLFEEIGHRLTDALSSHIAFRSLRESERRFEEAQRVAHLGYWDRDLVANRFVLSEESWRIFGVEPHERPADLAAWTRRWQAFIHPDDRPRVLAAVHAALAGGPRYDVEFRIIRKSGQVRVIHSQGDVSRDASGRAVRMFGTQQDITALRESEQRLQAAQRLAHVGWWERDYDTGRVSLSDEA
ncbi:MAG: PAS domain-containing protein, partial [Burkholderiales bacterium]